MVLQRNSKRVVATLLVTLVVLSGCSGVSLTSDDLTAKEIGERAQQKYGSIENYEGTLTVSIVSEDVNRTSKARVWVEQESNEFRYEYVSPDSRDGDVMVSNGSVMWTYNASENAVQRTDLSGLGTTTMATNYTRLFQNLMENYDIDHRGSESVDGRSTYVIELTPEENGTAAGLVEEWTLWIDKDTWFPVKTETVTSYDGQTQTVTNTYTNLSFDTDIPASTFEYEPPADATAETNEMPDMSNYESVAAADANASFDVNEPKRLPDGYEFTDAMVTNASSSESVILTYEKGSESLTVRQSTQSNGFGDSDAETVTVDGREARIDSYGSTKSVTWTCGGHLYAVTGTLSNETLIEVGESIDCE